MKNIIKFIVKDNENDQRVDLFLSNNKKELSRTRVKNLILNQRLFINEKICTDPSKKVSENDNIKLEIPEPQKASLEPFDFKLNVIYEDKDLMVINKPAGISMHPGAGDYNKTLVNALIFYDSKNLSTIGDELRPGIVHRIDKDTSGLLVIAKSQIALSSLSEQFFHKTVDRKYLAIVWGEPKPSNGIINENLSRDKKNRMIMSVPDEESIGKKAITHYEVIESFGYVSLVECVLETGRTHQIRAHMKHIGNPIFNDIRYGGDKILKGTIFSKYKQFVENCFKIMPRQALHAKTLGFIHPKTNKKMCFESDLPNDFNSCLEKWKNYSKNI